MKVLVGMKLGVRQHYTPVAVKARNILGCMNTVEESDYLHLWCIH